MFLKRLLIVRWELNIYEKDERDSRIDYLNEEEEVVERKRRSRNMLAFK